MKTPALELINIHKTFDLRLLYKNVTFTVYPKQTVLITGKNGAGKSTLLKMVAGLLPPNSGTINIHIAKEKIGYLGHQTFIYSQLTAIENLRFWTQAFCGIFLTDEEIIAILKKVRLEKFCHDKAGIFSRGMAQRLNIARILLQKPQLLLLDEPSTGLDKESCELFYSVIQEFQQDNASILWVSHNQKEDFHFATHNLHIEKQQVTLTPFSELKEK